MTPLSFGPGCRRLVPLRWALAALGAAIAVVGCSSEEPGSARPATTAEEPFAEAASHYPLPPGLEQVPGTVPLGRPFVLPPLPDGHSLGPDGEAVYVDWQLYAAYRVVDGDPVEAVERWLHQLNRERQPWENAGANCGPVEQSPTPRWCFGGDGSVRVELWATDGDPLLLVNAMVHPRQPAPWPIDGADAPMPTEVLDWGDRGPGEVFIEEQGVALKVPEAARAVTPDVPLNHGVGDNHMAVLVADDGTAALTELGEQAVKHAGLVVGPHRAERDGAAVASVLYTTGAGGPTFQFMSIEHPEDGTATIYVVSRPG